MAGEIIHPARVVERAPANRRPRERLLLVVPGIYLAATFGVAIVVFIRASLFQSLGPGIMGTELTAENYRALTDSYYLGVLRNTIEISLWSTVGAVLVGYPLTYVISRSSSRRATVYMAVVLGSAAMSFVVRALGWIGILDSSGPVSQVLQTMGLIDGPARIVGTELGVVIALVHGLVPLFVLTLLPVLRSIDPSLEQVAEGLGAGPWTVFRRVTLPLSVPGVVAGALLVFALAMGAYTTQALLGGGRVAVFPILIQQQVLTLLNYPRGAALSAALLLVVLVITWMSIAVTRRWAYDTTR